MNRTIFIRGSTERHVFKVIKIIGYSWCKFRPSNLAENLRMYRYPDPAEVVRLNTMFSDPRYFIRSVFKSGDFYTSKVTQLSKGRRTVWRVQLDIILPVKFRAVGRSPHLELAKHYAFLEACAMFKIFGLADPQGNPIDYMEKLHNAERLLLPSFYGKTQKNLEIRSVQGNVASDGSSRWSSAIELLWPYRISARGESDARKDAEHAAGMKLFLKLRKFGLTDSFGNISLPRRLCLPYCYVPASRPPEYELFIDASLVGFGAYLMTYPKSEEQSVRWLYSQWTEKVRDELRNSSVFIEFYALVSTIFTWKKKFSGKCVLVWSDNSYVVLLVNNGLRWKSQSKLTNLLERPFKTLVDSCQADRISLGAMHIPRERNVAAHSLAKTHVDRFKKIVPNTFKNPKKVKKVDFCLPLSSHDVRQEEGTYSYLSTSIGYKRKRKRNSTSANNKQDELQYSTASDDDNKFWSS